VALLASIQKQVVKAKKQANEARWRAAVYGFLLRGVRCPTRAISSKITDQVADISLVSLFHLTAHAHRRPAEGIGEVRRETYDALLGFLRANAGSFWAGAETTRVRLHC